MKIYRPVRTNLISQSFGLSGTSKTMLSVYNSMGLKAHNGLDFCVKCQDRMILHGGKCEEVYCNITGVKELKVTSLQRDDDNGYGINAQDENGNKYCWWHFDYLNPIIFVGTDLTFGMTLGVAGNTGKSSGAHLHFGYYPVGESKDNGYGGASDPMPFYDNRFCLDIKSQIGIIQKMVELLRALLNIIK